jgi:ADP-ribose pyrophosphatase
MRKVEVLSRRRLLDDFFKVDEVVLRHERVDGRMSPPLRRLNLDRGDAVAVLLFDLPRQQVILVRQFRYPTWPRGQGWILEIVAGLVDPGESLEAAAIREVMEETGYRPTRLEPVMSFYATPGGSSERIALFCAEVDPADHEGPGRGCEDEHEDIEVVEMPAAEAWAAVDRGEIVDAKTILALLWLQRRVERTADGHSARNVL